MALALTTLAGAKAINDIVINPTSATGAVKKGVALVDSEWMRITDVSQSSAIQVVPGYNGCQAQPHGVGAPVVFGLPQEFVSTAGISPNVPAAMSFGVDGAITSSQGTGVPVQNTVIYLTKATAGAYTLAAPAKDQQNTIVFVSTTAAAHTITYTPGFYGNTTSSDVATFPATINAAFTIKANQGTWAPIASMTTAGVTLG